MKDLEIVVVNYHTYALLYNFLRSLDDFKPDLDYGVTICDVESQEHELPELVDLAEKRGYNLNTFSSNVGYAIACNEGAKADARNIALFNADTYFTNSDCIPYCVDFLDRDSMVAVVGPLQVDERGRCTHAGIFGSFMKPQHANWLGSDLTGVRENKPAITVSGSAYFLKKSIWDEMSACAQYIEADPTSTGAFLTTPLYYEETWYSYHVQHHGYEVWYLGEAEMAHLWNRSSPEAPKQVQFDAAKKMFVNACELHGIPHD